MKITEDIRSITDLKRDTRALLDQVIETKRPLILTTNGKAEAVLVDAETFERQQRALDMARLLAPAEKDVTRSRTRPARKFFADFKRENKIRG